MGLHEGLRDVTAAELVAKVPVRVALDFGVQAPLLRGGRRVTGFGSQRPAREVLDQLLHGVHSAGAAEGLNDLRTHDHAVGVLADLLHVLPLGHAEAHGDVDIAARGGIPDALHNLADFRVDGGPRAGHAENTDNVDERVGDVRGRLHPCRRARRCDDRDDAELVLGADRVEVTTLLRGQVHDDEAVDALGNRFLAGLFQAKLQEVVVVAHKDQRELEALLACILDVLEAISHGGVVLQSQA
mmetsp:Transcript_114802/g.225242  ORF Transcript_114802/g.225242 Transcript_114802/m.225242 type:complete len:242 (+) Transcript_114802:1271-1996(+)